MAFMKKAPPPDSGAEYRKKMLANLPSLEELEHDFETKLEQIMENNLDSKQTIPAALIDEHLRKIKDLSGQADAHEAEGRKRLTLAKEARLGVAALEAANRVLQSPAEAGLPLASGLPPVGRISFPADADKSVRNNAPEDKGER